MVRASRVVVRNILKNRATITHPAKLSNKRTTREDFTNEINEARNLLGSIISPIVSQKVSKRYTDDKIKKLLWTKQRVNIENLTDTQTNSDRNNVSEVLDKSLHALQNLNNTSFYQTDTKYILKANLLKKFQPHAERTSSVKSLVTSSEEQEYITTEAYVLAVDALGYSIYNDLIELCKSAGIPYNKNVVYRADHLEHLVNHFIENLLPLPKKQEAISSFIQNHYDRISKIWNLPSKEILQSILETHMKDLEINSYKYNNSDYSLNINTKGNMYQFSTDLYLAMNDAQSYFKSLYKFPFNEVSNMTKSLSANLGCKLNNIIGDSAQLLVDSLNNLGLSKWWLKPNETADFLPRSTLIREPITEKNANIALKLVQAAARGASDLLQQSIPEPVQFLYSPKPLWTQRLNEIKENKHLPDDILEDMIVSALELSDLQRKDQESRLFF